MYTDELIQGLSFRPKIYINLGFVPGTITRDDIKKGTYAQKINDLGEFKPIGAVQRMELDSTREVNVWRELDYLTAGKPVESYPGLTSYTVTLERVVLYESNTLEALGYSSFDVMRQTKPLTLKVDMQGPGDAFKYDKTWFVYGVWLKGNPMKFDITEVNDLRIIQQIEGVATGIIAAS